GSSSVETRPPSAGEQAVKSETSPDQEENVQCPQEGNLCQAIWDSLFVVQLHNLNTTRVASRFDDSEDEEDIDSLLEKPVEEANVGSVILPEGGEKRQKRVLKHRVTTPFECLPEGWVEVTHCSGLPVYVVRFFFPFALKNPFELRFC
ncbi:unnamed protein product, partial [Gongylonema pulchrum]|uniref:TDP43_N domain-containing protein n=1 Tax=Gongylonema pulchrum TaxID=637853 RepID=A0A183DB36_9BILA